MDAAPEEDAGDWGSLADPGKTPDEAAQSAEKCRAVHAAFLRLPAELREAMSWFIFEGLGYAAIAAVAQCAPKAVETRIYRARQTLREQLSEFIR
jgi:RNA polymerase sigma-70 factor (ECF subfamily)